MHHMPLAERAELLRLFAERIEANPEAVTLSWEYLGNVADSDKVSVLRRKENPDATQAEQYVRILPSLPKANSVVYLIFGSARVELWLPAALAADYDGHQAVEFKTHNATMQVHVHLGRTPDAPAVAIELGRRALAYETQRLLASTS
ncbi:hypothetical protein MTF65_14025 [Streptomyces sp. APSN-46.1]|uniref:hypothetical protein n=1 Tax=Streptomyces sp. APSN-46.1 TaxID=2929049 RepID=UPI001FB3D862|nr:hypothetical protein [Streptomyces sp. APSN-46.1]MCJ1678445.1 hypothetical protein [Streptomyces sp. APSN-46.1]